MLLSFYRIFRNIKMLYYIHAYIHGQLLCIAVIVIPVAVCRVVVVLITSEDVSCGVLC